MDGTLVGIAFFSICLLSTSEAALRFFVPGSFNFTPDFLLVIYPAIMALLVHAYMANLAENLQKGDMLLLLISIACLVSTFSFVSTLSFYLFQTEVSLIFGTPIWVGWLPASIFSILASGQILVKVAKNYDLYQYAIGISGFFVILFVARNIDMPEIVVLPALVFLFYKLANFAIPLVVISIVAAYSEFDDFMIALDLVASKLAATASNDSLVAVPFFVAAGALLCSSSSVRSTLQSFANIDGHSKVHNFTEIFYTTIYISALSGSSTATTTVTINAARETHDLDFQCKNIQGRIAAIAASGSTLGILMPPSGMLVLVAFLVQAPITNTFIVAALFSTITVPIYLLALKIPQIFGHEEKFTASGSGIAIPKRSPPWIFVIAIAPLLVAISGILTTLELALVLLLFGLLLNLSESLQRGSPQSFISRLQFMAISAGLVQLMIVFSQVLSVPLSLSVTASVLGEVVTGSYSVWAALALLTGVLFIMGMFLDPLTLVFLASPYVAIVSQKFELNTAILAVYLIVAMEAALLSPPLGLNLGIVRSLLPNLDTRVLIKNVAPFVAADLFRICILALILILWR